MIIIYRKNIETKMLLILFFSLLNFILAAQVQKTKDGQPDDSKLVSKTSTADIEK